MSERGNKSLSGKGQEDNLSTQRSNAREHTPGSRDDNLQILRIPLEHSGTEHMTSEVLTSEATMSQSVIIQSNGGQPSKTLLTYMFGRKMTVEALFHQALSFNLNQNHHRGHRDDSLPPRGRSTMGRASTGSDKVMEQLKANSHLWDQQDEIEERKEGDNVHPILKPKLDRIQTGQIDVERRKQIAAEEMRGRLNYKPCANRIFVYYWCPPTWCAELPNA
ncbi:hypothetical protein F5Y10DRAFT_268129 [Nemania abortiva]|nr:hypothetical protein F5Y10DRAFT_268129 [Nemania abortiva]